MSTPRSLQKFTLRDIVFIAILSAAMTLSGLLTMPLVMSVTLFGLRNMVSALLYSLLAMLGLMKVRKLGALSLMGLFHGGVLLMMAPVMFFMMVTGAMISELLVWLIFGSYTQEKAMAFAATAFIPMTFPTTLMFTLLLHGQTLAEVLNRPLLTGIMWLATWVLSYIGMRLGYKLNNEFRQAGKSS